MENCFHSLNELSAYVTSTALGMGSIFPNVTLPQFDLFSGFVHDHLGVVTTVYAPTITSTKRKQWEAYSVENQWWQNTTYNNGDVTSNESSEYIYRWVNGTKVSEPLADNEIYAPLWYVSNSVRNAVNENLLDSPEIASLFAAMVATNQPVLSGTFSSRVLDFAFEGGHDDHENHPHSVLAVPVYDSFTENSTIVGILLSLIHFDGLLSFFHHKTMCGIVCVIVDNCGTSISFQFDSVGVTFLGHGDLHDPTFDEFKRTLPLESYETMHEGICRHEIHVYPSSTFQEEYVTKKPGYSACIVAFSFVLMAALILIYDFTVKQRQEKVLKSALRSSNLISSLFPATVRDRLLNDNLGNAVSQVDEGDGIGWTENEVDSIRRGRPIADFFANTTVMCKYAQGTKLTILIENKFISEIIFFVDSCGYIWIYGVVFYKR
jgi:hypothetical protein